ncbi:succinate dehydrogenase / fumarate reductase cytochrome b subunit [Geomicrobium halophilum]|uniref:Succinate dehydrogenase / fumarate reductase cytochrome b subunit n=1 Tax=Geomicrobium halophilum TaxID=549000 RepID=A0A841PWF7_9BACL|nr:succinate dehydrogenase cytochrome b558 subunit [Geomicrobium halophilum]MBB6448302.1 succinate dehydrogenase / fumarate reductase cytochrome b subunit [Geomicrobium halophilum]
MPQNQEFFNRRLHSLLGVIPVGVFLIQHLIVNHFAAYGASSFNAAADFMAGLPFRYALEIFVIFLPLLYHAVYGIYIAFTNKNNTRRYGTFRNIMFLFQRVSGIFLVIFIIWHVWETRIAEALGRAEVNYDMMADILSSPFMLIFYIAGVVAATFHFSNGLWSFAVTWGLTVSPRSQKIMTYVSLGVFVVLTFIGLRAVFAFLDPGLANM